jgi:hypothetical protein
LRNISCCGCCWCRQVGTTFENIADNFVMQWGQIAELQAEVTAVRHKPSTSGPREQWRRASGPRAGCSALQSSSFEFWCHVL